MRYVENLTVGQVRRGEGDQPSAPLAGSYCQEITADYGRYINTKREEYERSGKSFELFRPFKIEKSNPVFFTEYGTKRPGPDFSTRIDAMKILIASLI